MGVWEEKRLFSYDPNAGEKIIDRRGYVRYVAAGIVVGVAAAAAGAYYLAKSTKPGLTPTISPTYKPTSTTSYKPTSTSTTPKINNPPRFQYPSIDIKPKYILPTPEYTVEFTPRVTDPDDDPLSFIWYVDGKEVSRENKYSTKLSEGEHKIGLRVSDGKDEIFSERVLEVEPEQIYPTKPLYVKYKGIRMMVGWKGMRLPISTDVTNEKLDIIRNELGCNSVIIFGNEEFEDDLIEAGQLAIEKGFDRIYIAPLYLDAPIDETVQKIGKFAKKVKALREVSDSVVYMVGHEFTFDACGIVPGETHPQRLWYPIKNPEWVRSMYWKALKSILPDAFKHIIALCKKNYGYQITYAATPDEAERIVPWSDPIFESIGTDAYIWDKVGWTENWVLKHFSKLKKFGKPINVTEWGCLTYKGASQEWGFTNEDFAKYPYDEDEQASYINRYCKMLNRANISGAFLNQFDDERLKGYGLYKATIPPYFGPGSSRKKGFYMYKSYEVK